MPEKPVKPTIPEKPVKPTMPEKPTGSTMHEKPAIHTAILSHADKNNSSKRSQKITAKKEEFRIEQPIDLTGDAKDIMYVEKPLKNYQARSNCPRITRYTFFETALLQLGIIALALLALYIINQLILYITRDVLECSWQTIRNYRDMKNIFFIPAALLLIARYPGYRLFSCLKARLCDSGFSHSNEVSLLYVLAVCLHMVGILLIEGSSHTLKFVLFLLNINTVVLLGLSLLIIWFCSMDSSPLTNKYGISPKYIKVKLATRQKYQQTHMLNIFEQIKRICTMGILLISLVGIILFLQFYDSVLALLEQASR